MAIEFSFKVAPSDIPELTSVSFLDTNILTEPLQVHMYDWNLDARYLQVFT